MAIDLVTLIDQAGISPSANTKKSSKSGGAKKAIGLLRKEQLEATLLFFGAGGHVTISGILYFCAFGVEQPPLNSASSIFVILSELFLPQGASFSD
ncbi:hypothetical protein RJ640_027717 [Escallonia rubra]|uniref:Uncharacterized protein n=1 Tax=Escallonia rubra TaxID=112253 RepID=A0AA88QJP1_9ASTE|nr:hypothetical protein RJ640_027717 [Escallonia rubra]